MVELGRRRVLVVAGEASGDLHGGFLVQELQRQLDLESFEPAHGEPWRWRIKPE